MINVRQHARHPRRVGAVDADALGGPAVMLSHPEHQLEAVAAILGIVTQIVVEAGVLAAMRFKQLYGLVHRPGVEEAIWAGADVVEPELHAFRVLT